MHTTAIGSHIRRCNRNLLLCSGLFLLAWWTAAELWGLTWLGLLLVAAISIIPARNIVQAWRRGKNIWLHPIVWRLARYGPPAEVAQQIDRELADMPGGFGSVRLTRSWLLALSLFDLRVVHLMDVMWAYKQVAPATRAGAGSTFRAIIHTRSGPPLSVSLGEETIDSLLTTLVEQAPWAVGGFDDELAAAWRDDWQGFAAAVDARREEAYLRASGPSHEGDCIGEGERPREPLNRSSGGASPSHRRACPTPPTPI